jgi:O-antigen/teichoic acid export membrane protein
VNKLAINRLLSTFNKGHERSVRAKKNIIASFFIKGGNIAVGLLLVPLTINYLDPTKYGIWITLSSILGWFGFFDIGLGHGLRNRFAEAKARGEFKLVKTYVSTTYAILALIISGFIFLFVFVNPFLNWNLLLNADEAIVSGSELRLLALIVFTFVSLSFVFKLITSILNADQRPAKASLFDFVGKTIALAAIFTLTKLSEGSLIYLGLAMAGAPVFVLIVSNIWFLNHQLSLLIFPVPMIY